MIRVLFVCLGNICRSPAAEAIFHNLVVKENLSNDVIAVSCGIGDWFLGQMPDPRMREAASERGLALTTKAKPFLVNYLDEFDYILAADRSILEFLHSQAKIPEHKAKIHLMTAFGTAFRGVSIGDPFYKEELAFQHMLDILEDACEGLLKEVRTRLQEQKAKEH